jgi:MoCo/4Fe-4S cofactor protein with predicted Tat translocation signal
MSSLIKTTDILDVSAVRRRLKSESGRKMWRSMNELADTPAFNKFLDVEFPAAAGAEDVDRRNFIKLMGASMALAGVTGCTKQPTEHIIPYVKQPEQLIPGRPLFFASALSMGGFSSGVLVESHMGRPTKIEGNPEHPASLGRSDVWMQARILDLYDPDRSQAIRENARISTWDHFLAQLKKTLAALPEGGDGLRLLTGEISSPTLAARIAALLELYPKAKWHTHEPVSHDVVYQGTELAFGEKLDVNYDLKNADVIVSLDSDFLYSGPAALPMARDFAEGRDVSDHHAKMNRLYALECTPSVTGSSADHRLALSPGELAAFAQDLASHVGVKLPHAAHGPHEKWVSAIADDLKKHMGRCVVIAGDQQPAEIHALAHAMNSALGATSRTVNYTAPVLAHAAVGADSLASLVADIDAEQVKALFVVESNPVYTAPAELNFVDAYKKVPFRMHHGSHEDETGVLSHWHIDAAHSLESWGDGRAFDGTVSVTQPLIEPLYDGKNAIEIIDALVGKPGIPTYEAVKSHWEGELGTVSFLASWKTAIHDGVIKGTQFNNVKPKNALNGDAVAGAIAALQHEGDTLVLRPDPCVWDGTFSNSGWMQELPKPLSKLTWDNAALVSPAYAKEHGLEDGNMVTVAVDEQSVNAPVWIVPGHPRHTVTLHLGYGREAAGRIGSGVGVSAYALQTNADRWSRAGVTLTPTGQSITMAGTQDHHSMEGRNSVRTGSLDEFKKNPKFVHEMDHHMPGTGDTSLYKHFKYDGYKWGMVIDLNSCLGCNACTTACQAENNITVVGKDQVSRGREMHWIRVDRYYEGDQENPDVHHQPVACTHCEQAPCEVVCPVGATVHSDEGLNDMVYNRCVGTRYCSNNCPYKVRRFNFYHYNDDISESKKLMRNPNVTVRMRGVMEKCTYCVQRINAARITAKNAGRKIRDGEIRTACQQACPTGAITFGDLNDPKSKVTLLKARETNYSLLGELGVRPRTTYLAKIKNTNPALAGAAPTGDQEHDHNHG